VQAEEERWQMLVTAPKDCAVDCQQLVYLARQIQIGLGRDASRQPCPRHRPTVEPTTTPN
jgi:hypothetical protein